jgi:hypothetical protein
VLQKGFLTRSGCHACMRPVRNIRKKEEIVAKSSGWQIPV